MKTHSNALAATQVASDHFGALLEEYLSERDIEYTVIDGSLMMHHFIENLTLESTAYMKEDTEHLLVRVQFLWTVPVSLFSLVEKKIPKYQRMLGNSFDLAFDASIQSLGFLFVVPRELPPDKAKEWLDTAFSRIMAIAPYMYEECNGGRALFGKRGLKLLTTPSQGRA